VRAGEMQIVELSRNQWSTLALQAAEIPQPPPVTR